MDEFGREDDRERLNSGRIKYLVGLAREEGDGNLGFAGAGGI